MARRKLTVDRHEEIKRRLADGRSLREIATALGCSRRLVRQIRDGERLTHETAASPDPLWMSQLEWPVIIHELGLGHPMKFIWEERAKALITYPNFWKQFYRKFPQYREATITAREFEPGERVEVDYAGDPIEWYEIKTGEIHKAYVFVSGLGFSQLLFAWAAEDMKSRNWLGCHRRMFEYYGGVSHVTVPDCLKTGVVKCHLYDPDLNEDYAYLAAHFSTAIVPARVRKPKDKAIVEGLVKILCRYFRFRFRRSRFTSIAEINRALMVCVERINDQTHRRFGVSRRERFEKIEKAALKAAAQRGVRRRRVENGEAAPRLLRRRGRRLLQRPAYPSPQKATNQAHRAPCRDLPESRALGDPSALPAESRSANQDPRALPRELDRLLRGDAAEAAVAVALHPSGSEHAVPRAL